MLDGSAFTVVLKVLRLLEDAGGDLGDVIKAAFRLLATLSRDLPDFKFGQDQLKVSSAISDAQASSKWFAGNAKGGCSQSE